LKAKKRPNKRARTDDSDSSSDKDENFHLENNTSKGEDFYPLSSSKKAKLV